MKRSAEYAVTSIEKDVYAIKPLNGGRLEQKRAYAYVSGFDVRWYMVRAGSADVEEDTKRSQRFQSAETGEADCGHATELSI